MQVRWEKGEEEEGMSEGRDLSEEAAGEELGRGDKGGRQEEEIEELKPKLPLMVYNSSLHQIYQITS